MTEKEKAIEDETIEVSAESTEKKTKKPHRRRAIVITVVVLALLTAGGIAWKAHADRLMAEARADCAAASERLRTATNDWNTLLNGSAADAAKTDRKSVKDAKMLDALSKTMKATIPKTVSCKADSRTGVQEAAKAITANAAWYKTHAKTLSKAVKAVESSKLDKTVDDAQALYDATSGKVQDDKTRASLLDAIKKRDADAIAKAVKAVNESKTAKEKADAEAEQEAKAEQEAAAQAAAAAAQAQRQVQSYTPSYTNTGTSSGRSYTNAGSAGASSGSAGSSSGSAGGSSGSGPISGGWGDPGACSLEDCSIPIQH
ncbi:hypothetical protein MCC00300_02810 [Bifidobacterium longum subsp. longum]|nr:colicin transporter [Bifidobacterium longum]GHM69989.1 hypothetical protein MCC00300_02810 [Bifidobacterium longum subsp. longum]